MAIKKWQPFSEIESFLGSFPEELAGFGEISIEQYDKGGKHVIEAEMPGMNEEDIDVSIQDGNLVLRAESREEEEKKDQRSYYRSEKWQSYYRIVPLPQGVITETAEASLDHGILKVEFTKEEKELPEAKKIKVKKLNKEPKG